MPSLVITAGADGDTLVPAPNAYNHIRVIGLDFTGSADGMTMGLKSNTTTIWNTLKNIVLNVDRNRTIDCAPGEALKLAASGGTVTGSIEYIVLGRPPITLTS